MFRWISANGRSRMKRISGPLVALMLLLVLASCGTAATTTTQSTPAPSTTPSTATTSRACQTLASVGVLLAQLSTVGDNTTVSEVKTIQQKTATTLDTLSSLVSHTGASGTTLEKLQTANNELGTTLAGMSDSATLGESAPKLVEFKSKVLQAQAAQVLLATVLSCGSTP